MPEAAALFALAVVGHLVLFALLALLVLLAQTATMNRKR